MSSFFITTDLLLFSGTIWPSCPCPGADADTPWKLGPRPNVEDIRARFEQVQRQPIKAIEEKRAAMLAAATWEKRLKEDTASLVLALHDVAQVNVDQGGPMVRLLRVED